MSRSRKKAPTSTVSSHNRVQVPAFDYDVKAKFIAIEKQGNEFSKQAKGILDTFRLREARPGVRGDASLRFFSSHTLPTHSDIREEAGESVNPVVEIAVGGMPYSVGSRYTVRPGRRGPIDLTIMIDGVMPDVREQRSYDSALYIVGLSVASAVINESRETDVNSAEFDLKVVNNFLSGGSADLVDYSADNFADLHRKLFVEAS